MPDEKQQEKAQKGLVKKLCEVMTSAGYVKKRGHNEIQNYDYATEADVLDMLRGELAKLDVFIFPSVVSVARTAHYVTKSNAQMWATDVMIKWTFLDGDSGETHECMMPGCGTDTGDKGLYKAITGSSKYLFLKAFMLPTGDDPEKESKDDKEDATGKQREIAERKIAEHESKKAAARSGEETIIFVPLKKGWVALSGNGLPIMKAEMTEDEKSRTRVSLIDGKWAVPVETEFVFIDLCGKYKVGTVLMDAPTPKVTADIESPEQLIIESTKEKAGTRIDPKTKNRVEWALLEVVYGGVRYVCWDKKLWAAISGGIGKPAVLSAVPSFDGKKDPSIDGIISIDGVEYVEPK